MIDGLEAPRLRNFQVFYALHLGLLKPLLLYSHLQIEHSQLQERLLLELQKILYIALGADINLLEVLIEALLALVRLEGNYLLETLLAL